MKFGYNFYKVKIQTLETKDFVGFGRKSDAWSLSGGNMALQDCLVFVDQLLYRGAK